MTKLSDSLELVCIGRTCVDLYGEQIGAPLESVQSFQMYVGGSASNVCIGAARLGIRAAMIARVGDEPLGRFVKATFIDENIESRAVHFDSSRLTGLITLALRKCDGFPRVFYYENSADLALSEDDIEVGVVADMVPGLLNCDPSQLEVVPATISTGIAPLVRGVVDVDGPVALLATDAVLRLRDQLPTARRIAG